MLLERTSGNLRRASSIVTCVVVIPRLDPSKSQHSTILTDILFRGSLPAREGTTAGKEQRQKNNENNGQAGASGEDAMKMPPGYIIDGLLGENGRRTAAGSAAGTQADPGSPSASTP